MTTKRFFLVTICLLGLGIGGCKGSREFSAVLIDKSSQAVVPSAWLLLAPKTDGKLECVIDTSLAGRSNDRGEVLIPNVRPGEYVVFYTLAKSITPALQAKVLSYDPVGLDNSQAAPQVRALARSIGGAAFKFSMVITSSGDPVEAHYYTKTLDLAMITSKGELLTVRMPRTTGGPVRITINTEIIREP